MNELSPFKQIVRNDNRAVFLNLMEFADTHTINGREMSAIIDSNELEEREKAYKGNHVEGIYKKTLLIYVLAVEFGRMPAVNSLLSFDGISYRVTNAINEDAIYSIEMEAVRS